MIYVRLINTDPDGTYAAYLAKRGREAPDPIVCMGVIEALGGAFNGVYDADPWAALLDAVREVLDAFRARAVLLDRSPLPLWVSAMNVNQLWQRRHVLCEDEGGSV